MKKDICNKNKYEKKCEFCVNARIPNDKSVILCDRKGIVAPDYKCSHYKYDPLKRKPNKLIISSDGFSPDEFKL